MTNHSIKLEIINVICGKLKWNKTETMENIKSWKCLYEYNVLDMLTKQNNLNSEQFYAGIMNLKQLYERMGHSLLIIEAENRIYGLFKTMEKSDWENSWYYIFSESLAFDCGQNSSHNLSDSIEQYIDYREVRKATEGESKTNEEVYERFLAFYPMIIQYHKSGYILCGSFGLKWFPPEEEEDVPFTDFERITRMELWSIPRIKIL